MKEKKGDIWSQREEDEFVVITVNGSVKGNGRAVMGRGVALDAAVLFPDLPAALGMMIEQKGNHVFVWPLYRIITFPVKEVWMNKADLKLIERSCGELVKVVNDWELDMVHMVRPGCEKEGLLWEEVRPVIEPLLDDRFVVVNK